MLSGGCDAELRHQTRDVDVVSGSRDLAAIRFKDNDGAHRDRLSGRRLAHERTAIGAAFLTWVVLIFMTGSADRVYVLLGISYVGQIWAYRIAIWVLPIVVLFVTRRVCLSLQEIDEIDQDRERAEEEAAAAEGAAAGGP